MRVFITGANGQLGKYLQEVFSREELYRATLERDDITQPQIIKTIQRFRPHLVIHAAALTDVDQCELNPQRAFLVNEEGTKNIAAGAQSIGARTVYVSSDYVFDGKKREPYREDDPTLPINIYGRSKLFGENVIRSLFVDWIVVRTSWLYGRDAKNFVTDVISWSKSEPPLRLVEDKFGSPTYAKDLAQAIWHLVNMGAKGIYHVSGEGVCNWLEYGREILRLMDIQKEIISIAFEELKRPAKRPDYSLLDHSKLAHVNYRMRSWKEALRDFLETELSVRPRMH